jgi:hypothetical protein
MTAPSLVNRRKAHLDAVTDCIGQLERQPWPKPLVHIIDREADSVRHLRAWQALGCHWLVRVKDNPKVTHEGMAIACKDVVIKRKISGPTRSSRGDDFIAYG